MPKENSGMSERSSVRLLARWLSVVLVTLFCCLALLIPGGPIENRDFSHLAPATVWIFNSFLTLLGFSALIVAYFVWKQVRWAFKAAFGIGLSFAVVDLLDLLHIFPSSPTPKSPLLWGFVLLILDLSGIAIFISLRLTYISRTAPVADAPLQHGIPQALKRHRFLFWIILLLLCIAAIVFASLSILHSPP